MLFLGNFDQQEGLEIEQWQKIKGSFISSKQTQYGSQLLLLSDDLKTFKVVSIVGIKINKKIAMENPLKN